MINKAAFMQIGDAKLRSVLSGCSSVAIVGAKDKPGSAVDSVGRYLINQGFSVYPVHPARQGVWGLTTYAALADIPKPVDIVCLFRASQYCADHARETLALPAPPKIFWMQSGITSLEAGAVLSGTATLVVEDLCLMIEHRRLFQDS